MFYFILFLGASFCSRLLRGDKSEAVQSFSQCSRLVGMSSSSSPELRSKWAKSAESKEPTSTTTLPCSAARKVPARASSWASEAICANQCLSSPKEPSPGFFKFFGVFRKMWSTWRKDAPRP